MRILGISAFYHDSAAALVCDGSVVAAAQEERFSRRKHDADFPGRAIQYCLEEGCTDLGQLDSIVFYEKPFLKFERLLETYLALAPRGLRSFQASMPLWLREKLVLRRLLTGELQQLGAGSSVADRLLFSEHHLSHAASAFFPSPFDEAAVLTLDGVGEWATTSTGMGSGNQLEIRNEIHFPHSLGLLYSAFTAYTGFRVNSGEYKLMGLAPYGRPRYVQDILEHLIDLKPDGSFRLNLEYFDYCTGLSMTSRRFEALFGGPSRTPEEPITAKHQDLAASAQAVTEEVVLRMTRSLAASTGARNLSLAGGVAMNCVANGKVLRDGKFDRIWIQPAAGDAGGALGAALAAYHLHHEQPREPVMTDSMSGALLGPDYRQHDIEFRLREAGARFETLDDGVLFQRCAGTLAAGKILGWFQGRMEFGPRALGARSILADPRLPDMRSRLNSIVKRREDFRPFAPSVLSELCTDYFDLEVESPYMAVAAPVRRPADLPAVTHVNDSARVQTVHRTRNARFHALLESFRERTGCGVLLNTSFNVSGEPIVCTPEDAFRCFLATAIDALAIGNCFLRKIDQDQKLAVDYSSDLEPD